MGDINEAVTEPLVTLFSIDGVALAFALVLMILCAAILLRVRWNRYVPVKRAVDRRREALAQVLKREQTDSEAQDAFADQFNRVVDPAMSRDDGVGSDELRLAWTEFKETIVDPGERPLRNTVRPYA